MASIFRAPQVIITGRGAHKELRNLPELKSFRSALLITDNTKIDEAVEKNVKNDLAALEIAITEYRDIGDRVTEEVIEAGLERASSCKADLIVSIGGRAAVKIGKLIAIMVTNGGNLEEYVGIDNLSQPPLKMVAIAMTASSGSAISNCACYNDRDNRRRCCIADAKLIPAISVLDPGLTNWQSPQEIAGDGIISLGHAIEALASDMATPVTDACSLAAITDIVRWLPDAYAHSQNIEARERLMFAQQLVAMARSNTITSTLCKLAGQVEVHTHIPLGNVVAAILPWVLEHYERDIPDRINLIGKAIMRGDKTLVSEPTDISAPDEMRGLIQRLDMPLRLSFLGLEESDISDLVGSLHCGALLSHTPLPSDEDVLSDLLRKAL